MKYTGQIIKLKEDLVNVTNHIKELEVKRIKNDIKNTTKIQPLYDVKDNILKKLEELENGSKC